MSEPAFPGRRTRAYLEFVVAVLFFFLARATARRAAEGLAGPAWEPLVEQAILLFLLVVVFATFGLVFDRQAHPVSAQGLPLREGWRAEAGLGLAVGWGAAVLCVLPLAAFGGIAIILSTHLAAWGWLIADALFFACLAMAEEVAFRGYGFQRFEAVVGPLGASLGFAAFYAILQALLPGSTRLSIAVSAIFTLVLSLAYVRTRALWVSWGINFGWKASRALLFGLTVNGVSSHSSVIEGDAMGPLWLTGGGYGLDSSWLAFLVLIAALPVVYKLTHDLDFRYNAPVFVPGGIPVNIEAIARSQHEAAMGQAAAPPLVQIQPGTSVPSSSPEPAEPKATAPEEPH